MRTLLAMVLVFSCLTCGSDAARGQEQARAIVEKAVKAHGGAESLGKFRAAQSKSKGKIELMDGLNYTQEMIYQLPNQFRETTELTIMDQKIIVTTVFNGEKGWLDVNGRAQELDDKFLTELKEAGNLANVSRFVPLLENKEFKLSPAGDAKVQNRPAVAVRIERKGFRDVTLFFDKENGLLLKLERRALDVNTGQEVSEERIITEYHKVEGMQSPKKVIINRDGKRFMEAEVLEVKMLEKVDPKVFTKPVSQ